MVQVPQITQSSDIIHPPPPDAAAVPLQTVAIRAFVVLAAAVVVAAMVVQDVSYSGTKQPRPANPRRRYRGGDEHTMPPGPGGVADATITVYVEDSGGTVYAAAIVVRKARCRPSHLVGRMATNATIMNITTTTSIGWWDRRCGGGRAGAPARRGIVIAVWILPCRHRRRQRQHSRGGRRCPPTRQSMYPSTSSGRYMRRELSQR